jgi:hypothetical protein
MKLKLRFMRRGGAVLLALFGLVMTGGCEEELLDPEIVIGKVPAGGDLYLGQTLTANLINGDGRDSYLWCYSQASPLVLDLKKTLPGEGPTNGALKLTQIGGQVTLTGLYIKAVRYLEFSSKYVESAWIGPVKAAASAP